MTDDELADLERLCEAATPGPWRPHHDPGIDTEDPDAPPWPGWCVSPDLSVIGHRDYRVICRTVRKAGENEPEDAAFIAAARTAVPALIRRVRELEQALAARD